MMTRRPDVAGGRLSAFHDGEDGVSLVEALVAIVILATAILALAATAATSTVALRVSRDRQQATQTASAALERVRALDYQAVALDAAGSPPATYAYDGTTTETVVAETGAPVAHVSVDGRFTTTTYVTWANASQTLKRVVVITGWSDRGQSRTVTESTLVAQAQRGLPAPRFLVTPEDVAEKRQSGTPVCFRHNLVNLGERDSYSVAMGYVDTSGTFQSGLHVAGASTPQGVTDVFEINQPGGGKWIAWAKLGDGDPIPDMRDVTADARPDSAAPVERRETTKLEFCYDHKNGSTGHEDTPSFAVRVYSAFDSRVVRDVTNRVVLTQLNTPLYWAANSNQRSRFELTTTKPVRTDVSTDHDTGNEGNPGLKLAPGVASDAVRFDYQPGQVHVSSTGRLVFYLATPASLAGSATTGTVTLDVRLTRVSAKQSTTLDVLFDGTITVDGSVLNTLFTRIERDLTFSASPTFAATDYLRLSITNASTSPTVHLHFDVNEFGTSDDGVNGRFLSRLEIRTEPA